MGKSGGSGGKKTTIGLTAVALVLIVAGVLGVKRLPGWSEPATAQVRGDSSEGGLDGSLDGGTLSTRDPRNGPTILKAQTSFRQLPHRAERPPDETGWTHSETARRVGGDDMPRHGNYMPKLSGVPQSIERWEPSHALPPAAPSHAGRYVVQPDDSLWTISKKLYGTGAFFKALRQHNRQHGVDPDRLQVGDQILTPREDVLRELFPDLVPD